MRTLKITAASMALSVLFLVSGCNKDSQQATSTPTVQDNTYDAPDYRIADLNVLDNPEISQSDETADFTLRDSARHDEVPPCMRGIGMNNDGQHPSVSDPQSLPYILREMKLDSSQRASIKQFLAEHCDCVANHIRKVQEINHELIRKANEDRRALYIAYKNGQITREQLREKTAALLQNLKDALRTNNSKKTEMEIIRKCREHFYSNVESILTSTQLQLWNRWLQNH